MIDLTEGQIHLLLRFLDGPILDKRKRTYWKTDLAVLHAARLIRATGSNIKLNFYELTEPGEQYARQLSADRQAASASRRAVAMAHQVTERGPARPVPLEILCIAYESGLSIRAIAEAHDMPPSTVRYNLHRAGVTLRKRGGDTRSSSKR